LHHEQARHDASSDRPPTSGGRLGSPAAGSGTPDELIPRLRPPTPSGLSGLAPAGTSAGSFILRRFRQLARSNETLRHELARCCDRLNVVLEISQSPSAFDDPAAMETALLSRYARTLDATALLLDHDGCCAQVRLGETEDSSLVLVPGHIRARLDPEIDVLASLRYELSGAKERVKLAKIEEQPGFMGLGKYEVDIYYETVKRQINSTKKKLKKKQEERELHRIRRAELGFSSISLAGYTNAGKSSLFNVLTEESVPVDNALFTTLSTTTRAVEFSKRKVLLTDTVGFIDRLPLKLIKAFHSTLEETINKANWSNRNPDYNRTQQNRFARKRRTSTQNRIFERTSAKSYSSFNVTGNQHNNVEAGDFSIPCGFCSCILFRENK
jgi:hypothetical protein